jgi:cytochrome P450
MITPTRTPTLAEDLSLPPAAPWIGNTLDIGRDPLGFLTRIGRTDEPLAAFKLLGNLVLLAVHPEAIEQVLQETGTRFRKGYSTFSTDLALGSSLIKTEGEAWRAQRKLMAPAFHNRQIQRYAEVMVRQIGHLLTSWQTRAQVDSHAEMMRVTQEIVTQSLFSTLLDYEGQSLARAMSDILDGMATEVSGIEVIVPRSIPTPARNRLRQAVERVNQVALGVIENRRAKGSEHHDLLGMMMEARDENGLRMNDRQLLDEIRLMYIAGHETSANALTYAVALVSQHPEVRQVLEAEVDAVLGARPPVFEDAPKLVYTSAVLKEAMRLYPPVWMFARTSTEVTPVVGIRVPKGTTIFLSAWVTHRDGRWFEDPLRFKPERWLDGGEKRVPKGAYFPFGGGPRICIGMGFAQVELAFVLAMIAQRYRLDLPPGGTITTVPSGTLRPRKGLPVVVSPRP